MDDADVDSIVVFSDIFARHTESPGITLPEVGSDNTYDDDLLPSGMDDKLLMELSNIKTLTGFHNL